MLFAAILLIIIFYLGLGLVLWCLYPDIQLLLDLTSGLVAWAHQLFYQLQQLVKWALGFEPMPLGQAGEDQQVPSADGDNIEMRTPLHMDHQGQGGGGRRPLELDLNETPDPEVVAPYAFGQCMNKLTEIMMGMQTSPRNDLLPGYEAVEPIYREAYVKGIISDFLKQHSPEELGEKQGELKANKKSSYLYKNFRRYLLQLQGRGEE